MQDYSDWYVTFVDQRQLHILEGQSILGKNRIVHTTLNGDTK